MACRGYVFIACSLDGFIADEQGGLEWLECVQQEGEDYGYSEFVESMDAILMGRKTFEKVLTFNDWPYQQPVYVLSRHQLDIPAPLRQKVHWVNGMPADILAQLHQLGKRKIYIDGGWTISQFISAGLISEITINRVPVTLGKGIPLFSLKQGLRYWQHKDTKSYASGLVKSYYRYMDE